MERSYDNGTDLMGVKGESRNYDWLLAHVGYQGDDCLKWPFGGDPKSGRGAIKFSGARGWAHRLMCKLAHGEPPTPEHKATHDCGKGHEGCINPKHLSWKTQAGNLADCIIHGTQPKHFYGNKGRLTGAQADEIRKSRGVRTMRELAATFGVSEGAINDIWKGRSHAGPSKVVHWLPEEDEKLREALALGYNATQAAAHVGRSKDAVRGRIDRLGLYGDQRHG